jgi:signal transduction histidine kinase
VVVGFPTSVTFPPAREVLFRSLLLLVLMVSLALVVALYFSQRLSEPLRNFTKRALAISEGNFIQTADVKGSQEIQQLSKAFNIMSTNLSKHMHELALSKEENLREAKRLQFLLARTISLQEEERRRIASDLHDRTSQLILGTLYETEAAMEMIPLYPEKAKEKLNIVEDLLEHTSAEMRRVIYDLRPPLLDDMGLVTALERSISRYMETTGIQVEYEYSLDDTEKRLPPEVELAIYRIAQEALNNIHKHSQAKQAAVQLVISDQMVHMVIDDKGIGFEPKSQNPERLERLGLKGMIERAESVGAQLEIITALGQGTTINFVLSYT